MATPLVSAVLWERIEPLLPPEGPTPKGGCPRVPDRACLAGIIVVLRTGIPWELLPQEMGCRSGMTCERRLRDWHKAGVWERLHHALLDELGRLCRRFLRRRGIRVRITRKGIESSQRLGRHRWVVERTLAWLGGFRRLTLRYERRQEVHKAFLSLGCALICLRAVERFCSVCFVC